MLTIATHHKCAYECHTPPERECLQSSVLTRVTQGGAHGLEIVDIHMEAAFGAKVGAGKRGLKGV